MKFCWVWLLCFSFMAACSSGDVAGSTIETENTLAVQVLFADGTPAANAFARIASAADELLLKDPASETPTPYAFVEFADDFGFVKILNMKENCYILLASVDSVIGAVEFSLDSSKFGDTLKVVLKEPGVISGDISLDFNDDSVRVAIYGLGEEYEVLVDSLGHFEIQNVPEGSFKLAIILGKDNSIAGVREISVRSGASTALTVNLKTSLESSSSSSVAVSSSSFLESSSSVEEYAYYLFADFEEDLDWYTSVFGYATASLSLDSNISDWESTAAHFEYVNDSLYNWALMGKSLGGFKDFSTLDSVRFMAKGTGRISFSFDKFIDSLNSGKAWNHYYLQDEWVQFVITPADLLEADSIGGNVGWDAVKDSITSINVFGNEGTEFWIDDIEFFGVSIE